MLNLLERNVAAVGQRLVLLAPPASVIRGRYKNVRVNQRAHRTLLQEMQRLRGGIYLADGAIEGNDLSADGRHRTPEDDRSWHLLMLNGAGRISGCVWYREHENTVPSRQLRVRNCPLAQAAEWRSTLWQAVEGELARARRDGLRYAEIGGWAVAPESRCSSEGLVLALAAYSLGRIAGGALGLTTATVRHSSSTILRRIGGSSLEAEGVPVPSYYDPRYKCHMELLRFDSRRPAGPYSAAVDALERRLEEVLVVATPASVREPERVFAAVPVAA
jgi:hypothetical protein